MDTNAANEESIIQANIHRLQVSKANLLREIEKIDQQLLHETAKYGRFRNDRNPALQIPNEIITSIFMLVHNRLRYANSVKARSEALRFLLSISHVCTRWRVIVLNTCLLWNEIIMTFRHGFASPVPLECLEAHLIRSGDCYLDMAFNLTGSYIGYPSFLQLIGRHSTRWRRVSLLVAFGNVSHFQNAFQNLHTPVLEHFSVNIQNTQGGGPGTPRIPYPSDSPQMFDLGSPKLTFLRLAGAAFGTLVPDCNMLQTLHLVGWNRSFLTWERLREGLEAMPLLTNLSLDKLCVRHARDPFKDSQPMHLPKLRCLRIRDPYSPVIMMLPLMVLPKLESLHLHHLEMFDSLSIPTVTTLSLETCNLQEIEVVNLVSRFPNVEELGIDDCSFSSLFNLLSSGEAEEPEPWPKLHTLTVRELPMSDVVYLVSLVLARKERQMPLQVLRVDRRSRTVLRNKHRLDWLAGEMEVQHRDFAESWPPGLGYDDPHDLED
ncbi:hypothetical protein FA15DRAFT_634416 [Coprinopsis marcescibilis]|uniref:F-box domain-containing protein n=1 Tax=Coprinopsis marcescibilis TaxID=230819 RepID=A0A5C3L549_COPMA|nr:hypothetical protein FA15DRAFT_634416 [Coprinopsis marcescibilis]